jgi:photosystem II stability/assembly factor-like uncharacterized protein
VSARTVTIAAADPLTLYAAARGHVVRSDDGGRSWQPGDDGLPSTSIAGLATDPTDARTVYAAAGRVFKSTDAGRRWSPLGDPFGASVVAVDGGTLYAAGEHGIRASEDGGLTWRTRNASMAN